MYAALPWDISIRTWLMKTRTTAVTLVATALAVGSGSTLCRSGFAVEQFV